MSKKKQDETQKTKDGKIKKTFKGYLICNWKSMDMRILKTKPDESKLSPYEFPVKINIDMKIPEMPKIEAKGEIDIPPTRVKKMVIESL